MDQRTVSLSLLLLSAFAAAQDVRPLPELAAATRIHDTAADAGIDWGTLLDRLAKLDAVFLGETHIDDTTHRVELAVLEGLLAGRDGKVVLSLEMFERDVQSVLDDYLADRIDEATFLAKARPWQNYRSAYRPLIETAKKAGIPVIAANFPGSLRRPLASGGKQAIDALSPEQRALIPDAIFPASAAYWERVDRAVRGHMGGPGGGTAEERLYDTQNLWDNSMGDNVSKARAANPDSVVLHVAGGFHVAYRDGTVAQFVRRSPGSKFAVVAIAPTGALHLGRPDRDRQQADYLIYAQAVARDFNEGTYAVSVTAELRYRLTVPAQGENLPLLVWLPGRSTRPEDAFQLWQNALGDDAAIAVIEHPFPETQGDLAVGGRYVFGDGFRADYGRTQEGLARIVEYVTRRFPVNGRQVVVAGVGDGAAAVLWAALYGEWLDVDLIAIDPTDLTRLGMEALPDQKPVARSLLLGAGEVDKARLEKVAADYTKVGTSTGTVDLASAGGAVELVRARLGLEPAAVVATERETAWLVIGSESRRAREWAELYASTLQQGGRATRIVAPGDVPAKAKASDVRRLAVGGDGHWPVSSFASGQGLPLAGGPFGGTTVVVLPAGISDADRAAWHEHEQNKVVKRRSMFANIAVACSGGEPTLSRVMADLKSRGRSRVLIVPAVFCADAATMRELQEQLGDAGAGMDLSWLPGLGAELARSDR